MSFSDSVPIALILAFFILAVGVIAVSAWRAHRRKQPDPVPETEEAEPGACVERCEIYDRAGDPIMHECGHVDAPEFRISLWGQRALHRGPGADPLSCAACVLDLVLRNSIRCGSCGFAILPGHPVALCVDSPRIGRKEWKTVIDGQVVLCMRWECDAAPGFCGHWMGTGIKPLFPEGGSVIARAFETGEAQFVEIGPLKPEDVS